MKTLLGGDWNEPPFSTGAYSPAWIANQTGSRITHGAPAGHGRIDFVICDARVGDMALHATGGSDHNLRSFTVYRYHTKTTRQHLYGAIWNAQRDRDPDDVTRFLNAFLRVHRTDFVLLQEVQQYHRALRRIPGYSLHAEPGRGKSQNAILVSHGTKTHRFRVRRMAPYVWFTRDRIEHASPYMPHIGLDGWLRVASVHEVPRVDWRKGRMVGAWDRRRVRRVSAKRMVKFTRFVRAGKWDR